MGSDIKLPDLSLKRRSSLPHGQPLKVVIGASGICDRGWIPTEEDSLNLLRPHDWARQFHPASIHAMLAEHVWEHLTKAEGKKAAQICYKYLRVGGYLRVAVPDGLHPSSEYIEWVRPGGAGPGAQEHKSLFTYAEFGDLFRRAGFQVNLLEYFDREGVFHFSPWKRSDGIIHRSCRYDRRNSRGRLDFTSLILDAVKWG
jgi:predicted SAM-dependent methyltransferase